MSKEFLAQAMANPIPNGPLDKYKRASFRNGNYLALLSLVMGPIVFGFNGLALLAVTAFSILLWIVFAYGTGIFLTTFRMDVIRAEYHESQRILEEHKKKKKIASDFALNLYISRHNTNIHTPDFWASTKQTAIKCAEMFGQKSSNILITLPSDEMCKIVINSNGDTLEFPMSYVACDTDACEFFEIYALPMEALPGIDFSIATPEYFTINRDNPDFMTDIGVQATVTTSDAVYRNATLTMTYVRYKPNAAGSTEPKLD